MQRIYVTVVQLYVCMYMYFWKPLFKRIILIVLLIYNFWEIIDEININSYFVHNIYFNAFTNVLIFSFVQCFDFTAQQTSIMEMPFQSFVLLWRESKYLRNFYGYCKLKLVLLANAYITCLSLKILFSNKTAQTGDPLRRKIHFPYF